MTADLARSSLRGLDADRHPMLGRLTRDEIYDGGDWMAPGGLLLAEMLAAELSLGAGDLVLDLGCGRGQSSVYLASRHRVRVLSLDLWIGSNERQERAASAGVGGLVTTLRGDIGRGVPIAPASLDAIFCMQSFHCLGTGPRLLRYLASLLKPGGRIGIAQGCFREEVETFPPLFAETDGWNAEYGKYHSPGWWRNHFEGTGLLEVLSSGEVPGGDLLWDDDVLYRGEREGWSGEFLGRSGWLIRQILHGKAVPPSLTHCMVVARRREHIPPERAGTWAA